MTQLEYIRNDNLKSTLEGGRSLALNSTQVAGLKDNFKQKVPPEAAFPTQIAPNMAPDMITEPEAIPAVSISEQPAAPEDIPAVSIPEQPAVPEDIPAVSIPEQPAAPEDIPAVNFSEQPPMVSEEPIVNLGIPFDSGSPIEQPTENPSDDTTPVIDISGMTDNSSQKSPVEIIPNGKNHNTAYDLLIPEIKRINDQYNQQIAQINEKRQVEIDGVIEAAKQGILDLQEQASEHLKNAQAAEQIAHIAFNNAQSNQTNED